MSIMTAFLAFDQAWEEVYPWVNQQLEDAGLRVKPTFDLQIARRAQKDCICPRHGEARCSCQMLVLLVYHHSGRPITLMLHGYEGSTWLSLVSIPGQRAEASSEALIRRQLTRPFIHFSPTEPLCEGQPSV
jgi:hypothetical protein